MQRSDTLLVSALNAILGLTRFRGHLTHPNFWVEVSNVLRLFATTPARYRTERPTVIVRGYAGVKKRSMRGEPPSGAPLVLGAYTP